MSAFFRNALLYRLKSRWDVDVGQINEQLARLAFVPGTAVQQLSQGWVPSVADGDLVHRVGDQLLLTLRTEKKLLPGSVITQFTKQRAAEIEERQGYRPARRQMKEIKEQVTEELIPKAFSIFRDTRVWIDPVNAWLLVDTTSAARADEAIGLLTKSVEGLPLALLRLTQSPARSMTAWLIADEAPAGFTIDQDTELKSTGDSRAAVRYVAQSIEIDAVRKHIDEGKQCTRLAMTWHDRISFVLTEPLALKRIAPLDVIREADGQGTGGGASDDARAKFDSDFALMAGELAGLLADLVDALGGEPQAEPDQKSTVADSRKVRGAPGIRRLETADAQ